MAATVVYQSMRAWLELQRQLRSDASRSACCRLVRVKSWVPTRKKLETPARSREGLRQPVQSQL